MKLSQIASNIILSFILIATFISIFFFTYVAKIENEIVQAHIDNSVYTMSKEMNIFITPEKRKIIKEMIIKNMKVPEDAEIDKRIDDNNKQLFNKTIVIFSIILVVGIFILGILWFFSRYDVLETIKYSIIMLVVSAIVYFLFITYITRKYILVDQNYISYVILSALNDYSITG